MKGCMRRRESEGVHEEGVESEGVHEEEVESEEVHEEEWRVKECVRSGK